MPSFSQQKIGGFTVVELLVAIIIVALLAAISVVSYNGVQRRARLSAVLSTGNQVGKKLATYESEHQTFPASGNLAAAGVSSDPEMTFEYTGGLETFCLTVTYRDVSAKVTEIGAAEEGVCSGHTGPI